MTVKGLGWPTKEYTATGLPSVDSSNLNTLVGNYKSGKYDGEIYKFYER